MVNAYNWQFCDIRPQAQVARVLFMLGFEAEVMLWNSRHGLHGIGGDKIVQSHP